MKALLKGLFLCVTMHTSAQHIDPLLVLGKTTPPLVGNMQEEVYKAYEQMRKAAAKAGIDSRRCLLIAAITGNGKSGMPSTVR